MTISSGSGAALVVDLMAQVVMEPLPLAMHLVSAEVTLLPVEAVAP